MRVAVFVCFVLVFGACAAPVETPVVGDPDASRPVAVQAQAPAVLTLEALYWLDDARVPDVVRDGLAGRGPGVLARPAEWQGFAAMKAFTLAADRWFVLEAEGRPPVQARASTGGSHSSDGALRFVHLWVQGDEGLDRSVPYRVRPLNRTEGHAWVVEGTLQPPVEG